MGRALSDLIVFFRKHGVVVAVAVVRKRVKQDVSRNMGTPLSPGGSYQLMPSELILELIIPDGRRSLSQARSAGKCLDRDFAAKYSDRVRRQVHLDRPGRILLVLPPAVQSHAVFTDAADDSAGAYPDAAWRAAVRGRFLCFGLSLSLRLCICLCLTPGLCFRFTVRLTLASRSDLSGKSVFRNHLVNDPS